MKIDSGDFCPLINGPCKKLECKFFTHLVGKHPQTGAPVDEWDCAITWLPTLMTETTQQMRHACASSDKVATEVKNFHDQMAKQNDHMHKLLIAGPTHE